MMKYEFEALAGYEVSNKDYNEIIEPMYMALPEGITKQDFVKMLDRKRFALLTKKQIVTKMRELAEACAEMCEHRSCTEEEQELERLAHEYAKRFYGIDWAADNKVWTIFNREYTYPMLKRGCTFPAELVIGYGDREYARIQLVR